MAVRPLGSTTASGGPVGANTLTVVAPAAVQAGDALVLVATCVSASNGTIATPDGWVARHTITAPHARVMLTREATGDTNDNVTLTADVTGAFCATMVAYRGIDPDAWQGATSIDTSAPFTSGAHEPADGVLVCAFSMQNNSGMRGRPTEWVGLDGNLRAFAWGGMTSSYGGTNGIIDKLNATGVVTVEVDTTGVGERGGAVQWLELWNTEVLPELPGRGRIRSHVSEVAGSLFQATQAVAVESAVSEAFPHGVTLPPGVLKVFREALRPDDLALLYYPIPTRNQEMLVTVEGETNLGRMARTYPGPIMIRVADIPGHSGETMTAQQAIQYVFDRWSSEFAWFQPLPVPDLRLLVPEAVADPRQHYIDNPYAGVVTVEAIVIPQEGDDRRTMREIVDEWLAIFPGTIVRQNAAGSIELVPRVGPDAPDDAAVTLGWRDIISMSDGEDDPRGVVNRARCVSQGWTFEEDQALTPPLHVLGLRSDGLQESALEEVVDDLTSERLADGGAREFETFAEPDKPLTIEWRFRAFTAGTPTSTSLTTEVDLNGSFQMQQTAELEVSWFIFDVDNEKTRVRFTRQGNGIRARFDQSGRWRFGPNPFVGTRYAAYVLEFTVAGTGWVRANEQIVGEFSSSNGDVLPDADDPGQNALEVSESLFGEREATIRSSVFHLTPEQAQAVAQGYVLFNINPRTIRDVQQSEWNRYPVKFDHIGRLVDLPNGERAVVENRSYSDSFAPDGGFMQSAFTATVQELVIDTTTEYLFLDNGEFMQLDDGTLVEAS